MKRTIVLMLVLGLGITLGLLGCTQKAADSSQAIQKAETMQTVDQKVDYLVSQANAFVNSQEFDQAIKTAQYILSNLDSKSTEAQSVIDKAKAEMKKAAQGALDDVKNKVANF